MDFERIATMADMYRKGTYAESISNQLIKLQEELGEAAQAYIGAVGQNPRKGYTHTFEDLSNEIIDVIITGYVALATVQSDVPWQDVQAYFNARVNRTFNRAGVAVRAAQDGNPEVSGAGVPAEPVTPPEAPLPAVHPTHQMGAGRHSGRLGRPWLA